MILTVTPNPALDCTVHVPELRVGCIHPGAGEQIRAGGKGINVSVALQRLGIGSTVTGFVAGSTGRALVEELEKMNLRQEMIALAQGQTRINVKIRHGQETDLNAAGPQIDAAALELLLEKLKKLSAGDWLIVSGALPPQAPENALQQVLQCGQSRGVRCVADVGGARLAEVLPYCPFLIKPNREELCAYAGTELNGDDDIAACARTLQQRGAQNVLVSLGAEGALLLDQSGALYRMAAPQGVPVDSVGAGDSMVAGFVAGVVQGRNAAEALRLAVAAGSATAFSDGLATGEQIQSVWEQMRA